MILLKLQKCVQSRRQLQCERMEKKNNNHNSVFVWIAFDSCYNHEICALVVMKPDSYIDLQTYYQLDMYRKTRFYRIKSQCNNDQILFDDFSGILYIDNML